MINYKTDRKRLTLSEIKELKSEFRMDTSGSFYRFDVMHPNMAVHLEKFVEKKKKFYKVAAIDPETGAFVKKLFPRILRDDAECGFSSKDGEYFLCASFEPWTGEYMSSSYDFGLAFIQGCYPEIWKQGKAAVKNAIQLILIKNRCNMHHGHKVCDFLYDAACGYDKGMTWLTYVPTIRSYGFFIRGGKDICDALNYCPFCGSKLPERLDGKLTEILRTEYGLQSWRDYKKAPHEFHTEEWWKKRGL